MPIRLFAVLVLAVAARAAAADPPAPLDPETRAPYLWRIVLHTRPHPLLDGGFRARVRREVVAALQPALGPLGRVEFVDLADIPPERWEPLWTQFQQRGWPALDTPRELTGVKTHILHVEVRDGVYHLESRQHDGFSGLASPQVRRDSTRAAELVGRLAGLWLDRDFGACGTVELTAGQADEATIRFRGGALGPLDRFVKPGDVFAVAGLRKSARPPAPPPARTATGRLVEAPRAEPPPSYTSFPRELTLLRATERPDNGAVRCKVLTGYRTALPVGNGVVGYRCLRLPTVEAPLTLRLVDSNRSVQKNASLAQVRANDIGWAAPPGGDDLVFRDGLYHSSRALGHVAFVTLAAGATRSARIPVPVLGPDAVAVPFDLEPDAERRVGFERDCLDLARRVAETRSAQAACFDALSRMIFARKNADALARAKASLLTTAADDKELTAVLARLRTQTAASPAAAGLLAACDRQLADARKTQTELAARATELEAIVAKENDPVKAAQEVQAQALLTRIRTLIERVDIDEALVAYDQLATLLPDNADVKARRDKLRAEWTPKGEEHAKAREFLVKTWPALATIADWKDNLPTLRVAVDVCVKAGDKLTPRRLLASLSDLPVKLNDRIAPLDRGNPADLKLLTDAQEVREGVERVEADVRAFLK